MYAPSVMPKQPTKKPKIAAHGGRAVEDDSLACLEIDGMESTDMSSQSMAQSGSHHGHAVAEGNNNHATTGPMMMGASGHDGTQSGVAGESGEGPAVQGVATGGGDNADAMGGGPMLVAGLGEGTHEGRFELEVVGMYLNHSNDSLSGYLSDHQGNRIRFFASKPVYTPFKRQGLGLGGEFITDKLQIKREGRVFLNNKNWRLRRACISPSKLNTLQDVSGFPPGTPVRGTVGYVLAVIAQPESPQYVIVLTSREPHARPVLLKAAAFGNTDFGPLTHQVVLAHNVITCVKQEGYSACVKADKGFLLEPLTAPHPVQYKGLVARSYQEWLKQSDTVIPPPDHFANVVWREGGVELEQEADFNPEL